MYVLKYGTVPYGKLPIFLIFMYRIQGSDSRALLYGTYLVLLALTYSTGIFLLTTPLR